MLKMETPYVTLIAKKNNRSEDYLMLSELIDNSIGSWQVNQLKRELQIDLVINKMENFISCSDNAAGMDKDVLGDAIRLNKEKEGNGFNVFGVGLKNSAFWYGEDLRIITNDGKNSWETSIITSQVADKNKVVEWEVIQSNKIQQGTDVYINNIYDDKLIPKKRFSEVIIPILSTKYKKYLEGKRVNIIIHFFDSNEANNEKVILSERVTVDDAQTIPPDKIDDFIENINREFDSHQTYYLHTIKGDAIRKAKNSEKLVFKYAFPPKFDQEIMLDFTFGIQAQTKSGSDQKNFRNRYGLTTYQNDRAINIPPHNQKEFGEYTRTNIKRAYGYVELGKYFKTDNNKSNFIFGTDTENFDQFIKDIGKDLEKVCDAVANTVAIEKKAKIGNSEKNAKSIANGVNAKFSDYAKMEVNDTGGKVTFTFDDVEKEYEIKEEGSANENSKKYFIHAEAKEGSDSKYIITYNPDHPIWKPLVNKDTQIDLKTVVYPLVLIIGVAMINFNCRQIEKMINGDSFEYGEEINLQEFINGFMKKSFK